MNLSTARSMSRAKEVSLRKVVGSGRKQLIRQFLFESVFLSLISLIIALILVMVLLNPFNNLVGLNLVFGDIFSWYMILSFIILAVLVGLLSGSYPSFVLASFKPIFALKGNASANNGTTWLRNALVIYWQFRYMTNKDLGFDKEQLVVMERLHPLGAGHEIQTFKKELLTIHPSWQLPIPQHTLELLTTTIPMALKGGHPRKLYCFLLSGPTKILWRPTSSN